MRGDTAGRAPRLREANIDGPLCYADHGGSGPPILLVHGLSCSHAHWAAVAPAQTRFGRVLAPDLVGFGHSAPAGRRCTVEANARVVERFVTEVVGTPATVFGNSMGGLIGMIVAARSPRLVERLVLVDPAGPASGRMALRSLRGLAQTLAFLSPVGPALLRRQLRQASPERRVHGLLAELCVDRRRVPPAAIEALVAVARQQHGERWVADAVVEAVRSLPGHWRTRRYRAMVARIAAPTLVLHGEGDPIVPLRCAEELARWRPDWTYRPLPDTGHVPQLETPDALMAVVGPWLQSGAPQPR